MKTWSLRSELGALSLSCRAWWARNETDGGKLPWEKAHIPTVNLGHSRENTDVSHPAVSHLYLHLEPRPARGTAGHLQHLRNLGQWTLNVAPMRVQHTSHSLPAFPVYSCAFVSPDELVLGGGGGQSRSGIKNKLVRCIPSWPAVQTEKGISEAVQSRK